MTIPSSGWRVWLHAVSCVHLSRRYDEEDEALLLQADADVLQERQKQQEEWDSAAAARQPYIEVGSELCWNIGLVSCRSLAVGLAGINPLPALHHHTVQCCFGMCGPVDKAVLL